MMNMSPKKRKKLAFWIVGVATACILIFLGVQNISNIANAVSWVADIVMPLILGLVFALVLNVPLRFFERHYWPKAKNKYLVKIRRPLAYITSLILILGVLAGIIWLVIPELVGALTIIATAAVEFITTLSAMSADEIREMPFGDVLLGIDWDKLIKTVEDWVKTEGGQIIDTAFVTISSIINGIYDIFISIVMSIYIIFNKEKLRRQAGRLIRAWLPKRTGEYIIHASSVVSVNFRNFVAGQSLEGLILGVLCIIGMLILQIPYAPMVGALVGVTALIPIVGSLVGTIVGAFIILTADPIKAVIFIVFFIVLQQIEGNFIYPKVMGTRVNLPAMWILAAVTIGGGIAGAVGMLLSVPIVASIYILLREATEKRERKKIRKEEE